MDRPDYLLLAAAGLFGALLLVVRLARPLWTRGTRKLILRAVIQPALIFMMSSAQLLPSPDGTSVGKSLSHIMVFYPQIDNADYGLVESEDTACRLFSNRIAMSAWIVVMHDWVGSVTATQ